MIYHYTVVLYILLFITHEPANVKSAQLGLESTSTDLAAPQLDWAQGITHRPAFPSLPIVAWQLGFYTSSASGLFHILLLTLSSHETRVMARISFDDLRESKGLRIMSINARSLQKKVTRLNTLAHGVDYISTCETWFNDTIPTGTINMPNMAVYRTDRPNSRRRRGGGVACYVRYEYAIYT